jgi:serine/threonine-protein kinase
MRTIFTEGVMAVQAAEHPTQEKLSAFNRGALPPAEQAAVETHIAACDTCCSALAVFSEDRLVGLARQAASELPPTADTVVVPDVPHELIDHPRYRVISQLGAGGMGVVYKAEHRLMGRIVALKVIARRYTANPSAVERFRREFRAAARLNHPNIVTAHDADEANGLHFLVMECVEGVSLDRLVRKKGPLPIATACQCIRQAALGLQHAFEQKMVHRDIKPHNLMVTKKGQIKVLDFGLARVAAEAELPAISDDTSHPDRAVTSPSLVMGTPDYLAPEQARNAHEVDIRADIYALGCVLYFLLTGKPPFAQSGTALEKMLAQVNDEPESIRKIRPDVPEPVVEVLQRMMAKDRANRFETPGELATALKPFTRADALIDDAPDIVEPTLPIIEAPTSPIARAKTAVLPSRVLKPRKKVRSRRFVPLILSGVLGAIILGTVAIVLAFGGKDRGTQPSGKGGPVAGGPASKKVLFVVPQGGVWEPDYGPTKAELERAGVEVVTASTSLNECRQAQPNRGPAVKPTLLISAAKPEEYSAVIFCGGDNSEFTQSNEPGYQSVRDILNQMKSRDRVIAAICKGQEVLLQFGVLRGKRVSPAPEFISKQTYEQAGIKPVFNPVVTDARVVTAGKPADAPAFAQAILDAIAK